MKEAKFTTEVKDLIITAHVHLYHLQPFVAQIGQYMIPTPSWGVPTAGVTKDKNLYLNPEFAKICDRDDTVGVLAHESMHLVCGYFARMPKGAIEVLWNWASDIAINYLIFSDQGMNLPLPRPETIVPLYGEKFRKYDGWTDLEIYYDLLKENKCPICGGPLFKSKDSSGKGKSKQKAEGEDQQEGGSPGHEDLCDCCKKYWWDDSGSKLGEELEKASPDEIEEWKERIASAATSAKQRGKLPGALERFCTEIQRPKKNWKRIVAMDTRRACRRQYDWKRISRRTAGRIRTPGKSPNLPIPALYMDTSGSMSDNDLKKSINEMAAIIKLAGGRGVLILGDAIVYYCGEIIIDALRNLPVQRGGTDFRPVFEKIEEEKINPAIFIGFSDLCGPFPEIPPKYPVIWCRPEGYKSEAPFGKVIDIEIGN